MLLLRRAFRFLVGQRMTNVLFVLVVLPLVLSCSAPQALQLSPLKLGIPADAFNAPVIGALPDTTVLHVRVTFKLNAQELQKTEQQPIQPGKSSQLERFANKIGIDDSTYQKIKGFFNVQGLALNLNKLRTHLAIDGKASTFAKLLHTKFVIHQYQGRKFYAPEASQPPEIPNFLAGSIEAVTGLDNYSGAPQHDFVLQSHQARARQAPMQAADCSPVENTLLPRDVAGAYGHSQLWQQGLNGEQMTVNLVEIDGSYREDIQNYLECINFQGHLSTVNVDGAPRDALGESTLDIQMVAGLARSVNIRVYQTNGNTNGDAWTQVNDMLQRIADDNVNAANSGSVVSISLGAAEGEMSADDAKAIDSSLQQLTRIEHMTVFAASGDCGAFTSRVYGDLSVSFPASDSWVTSVGGTILQVDAKRTRANEIVWSDISNRNSCKNRWGSGGGNSVLFAAPSWQNAPGIKNRYTRGARQIPDVAAAAYSLAVYFQGQWGSVGGTSAAAPIWAAGTALVNEGVLKQRHPFSYGPQMFYLARNKSSEPYYDVTQGNNLYYPATVGWDFATGLGTPNLANLSRVMSTANA